MHRNTDQVVNYVELVTGTITPSSANDVAGYLYGLYHLLDELHVMLKTYSPYQIDIVCRHLHNIQESMLVNAKHYEGKPIQLKIF